MTASALRAIRHLDYTVIFARDLAAMRRFYADTMGFEVQRELGESWIEFRIGASVLALTRRGMLFDDPSPPPGALSLQLAFRVAPSEVYACAAALRDAGVRIEKERDLCRNLKFSDSLRAQSSPCSPISLPSSSSSMSVSGALSFCALCALPMA